MDVKRPSLSLLLIVPPDLPGATAIDVNNLPRILIIKSWGEWDFSIGFFVSTLVALTTVTTEHVLLNHRAQSFPSKHLTDQIDHPGDTGMLQVGVIPLNNPLLDFLWYPNEAIDGRDLPAVDYFRPNFRR